MTTEGAEGADNFEAVRNGAGQWRWRYLSTGEWLGATWHASKAEALEAAIAWLAHKRARRPAYGPAQRDRIIVELRDQGLTLKDIAGRVGMTEAGISLALKRIKEGRPGRGVRDGN